MNNAIDYRAATTQDLIISATRYRCMCARRELERRGINWTVYA